MSNELASTNKTSVAVGRSGIQLSTLDEIWRFATAVSKSGLAPKGIQTPEAITVAIQMGLEIGLTPMSSLQNIAVINGRPSLWGDSMLGICRGTGELEEFDEWFEAGGKRLARNPTDYTDDTMCVCRVKRRGYPAMEQSFSVNDAKMADLWNKAGPWKQYPGRMLKFRARSFTLRDSFGDALKGIKSAEEQMDTPEERYVTGREVPGDSPAAGMAAMLAGSAQPREAVAEPTRLPAAEPKKRTASKPETAPVPAENASPSAFSEIHSRLHAFGYSHDEFIAAGRHLGITPARDLAGIGVAEWDASLARWEEVKRAMDEERPAAAGDGEGDA